LIAAAAKAARIQSAKDSAMPFLREFQQALQAGVLVVCFQCSQFTFGAEPTGLGRCERYQIESWPFAPFKCERFERRKKTA
jgi:hypothetical protein